MTDAPPRHAASDTWEVVPVDLRVGIPTGPDIAFACLRCGDTIPTMPAESAGCRCGNAYVDLMGRILFEDQAQVRVLRRAGR